MTRFVPTETPEPGARTDRCGTRRVVRVARVARPGAALIAEDRRKDLRREIRAARIAGPAAVVLGGVRFGEDDRAGLAQPRDQRVIARRKIDVVGGVGAAGGPHILGVERILERERDAVHGHRRKIGIAAILLVEFVGALERIRLAAEFLADRRRSRRQRPGRRMPVKVALARHRSLATNVEHPQRAHLAGVWNAHGHSELLLNGRVGRGGFHAAKLDRRGFSRVAIGSVGRRLHRGLVFAVARQVRRCHVLGDELIAGAVVSFGAVDVRLHQSPAGELALANGPMDVGDCRLEQAKPKWRRLRVQLTSADAKGAQHDGDEEACPGE